MPAPAAKQAEVAARRAKAVRMRTAGRDWQTIADALGYSSRGAACQDVTRALKAYQDDLAAAAEDHRVLALARLDDLLKAAHEVLERKHITVNNGKVIYLGEQPIEDDAPTLMAIKTILQIEERRAKLLGLDTPVKQQVEVDGSLRYEIVGVDLDQLK